MRVEPCSIALKEWAVICRALETGRQLLLLRKGGIREGIAGFQPEHERFWLYPTQFHQGAEQLASGYESLLSEALKLRGADGGYLLRSLAMVVEVRYLTRLEEALSVAGMHGWSDDAVRQRFTYRTPGLYLFVLRVACCDRTHVVDETPVMAGCKSWVELPQAFDTGELQSVVSDMDFARRVDEIKVRLASA